VHYSPTRSSNLQRLGPQVYQLSQCLLHVWRREMSRVVRLALPLRAATLQACGRSLRSDGSIRPYQREFRVYTRDKGVRRSKRALVHDY